MYKLFVAVWYVHIYNWSWRVMYFHSKLWKKKFRIYKFSPLSKHIMQNCLWQAINQIIYGRYYGTHIFLKEKWLLSVVTVFQLRIPSKKFKWVGVPRWREKDKRTHNFSTNIFLCLQIYRSLLINRTHSTSSWNILKYPSEQKATNIPLNPEETLPTKQTAKKQKYGHTPYRNSASRTRRNWKRRTNFESPWRTQINLQNHAVPWSLGKLQSRQHR